MVSYTVPGMKTDDAERVTELLQDRLNSLNDLALTLDVVYSGIIEAHRAAIDETEKLDLVSQDMLIEQAEQLEQFQWFVRAHLESADGALSTGGVSSEGTAAQRAKKNKK